MTRTPLYATLSAIICATSIGLGYVAGAGRATPTSKEPEVIAMQEPALDKGEVEKIVRNYLMTNPEILSDVQVALETKRNAEEQQARLRIIKEAEGDIFNAGADSILGNPKGDVTVVEFFDYNCGYCRRALSDMDQLIENDKNVRFVLKELPILGPDSLRAHIVAQSFRKLMPDKYGEFHRQLLSSGHADENSAISLALSLGATEADLRTGMESKDIGKVFELNNKLASDLNITGTPSYVIKDEVVPGALGYDTLAAKIANVRECKKATC
jgi:protein-disulfide isomerase